MSISEYFNCSYEEDVEIEKIAFHYFYNPSKWTKEENAMSSKLRDLIDNEGPFNHVIERGIITSFSFFLDHDFLLSNNDQFPNQPGIPANWRNNIGFIGGIPRVADYFMRLRNQTYRLSVFYDSTIRKVTVDVAHVTVNHKPCTVRWREVDLLALSDAEHRIAYALHFVEMCAREFRNLVQKAVEDKPPTAQRTPLH